MKKCSKCRCEKPISDFYAEKRSTDGRRSDCKLCVAEYKASRQEETRTNNRVSSAAWRSRNPGKAAEKSAAWREKNPDKAKASTAAYHAANPHKARERERSWLESHPDARRTIAHNYHAKKRANGGTLSVGLAEKLFKLQRGKCACGCKQSLGDDYHLDHRMPLALGGTNTDDNIQLLTGICNRKKGAKHPVDFMQSRGMLL